MLLSMRLIRLVKTCNATLLSNYLGNTAAKVGQTTCLKGTLAMGVPCLNFYCLCQNRKLVREANGVEVSHVLSDCPRFEEP